MGNEQSNKNLPKTPSISKLKVPKLQQLPSKNALRIRTQRTQSSTLTTPNVSCNVSYKTSSSIITGTPDSPPLNSKNEFSITPISENNPLDSHNNDEKGSIQTIIQHEIQNGVTGKYLSLSIAETAYIFWLKNLHRVDQQQKLVKSVI